MNDVVAAKVATIQRCIARAREEHERAGEAFSSDFTRQDAAILNVLRACEAAIDLANYVIRIRKLGIPSSSRESFALLQRADVLSQSLYERLSRMVGFRNISVHAYTELDVDIVSSVITSDLDDLLRFTDAVISYVDETHQDS